MSIFRVYRYRPSTARIRLTEHSMGRRLYLGNDIPSIGAVGTPLTITANALLVAERIKERAT